MDIEVVEERHPMMDINEIKCVQLSDEWFFERLERLTSSKFDDLMPSSRQKLVWNDTQLKILKEIACQILTGERKPSFTNSAMQWGIETEEEARRYYGLKTMQVVRESGFWIIDKDLGDSPDGIIEDSKKVWECKCPASTTHLDYFLDPEKLFKKYKWQCYGHMWATGYNQGDLISYDPRFPEEKRMVIYPFKLVPEDMELLKTRMYLAVEKIKEFIK